MKLLKSLTLGLALAATIGSASAQTPTVVNISGSTAFRKAVHAAIIDYLTTASNNPVGSTAALCAFDQGTGSTPNNASNASAITFVSNDSAHQLQIECFWSGSAAGTIDLVAGNSLSNFVDPALAIANNSAATHTGNNVGGGFGANLGSTNRVSGVVDYAFVDTTFQTVASSVATASIAAGSTTTGGATTGPQLQALIAGSGLTEAGTTGATAVGIVPFAWYIGNINGAPAPFTNITTEIARTLLTVGTVPLPFLTNNSADSSAFVYLLGRAQDSGTRATTLVNSEFPVGSAIRQWRPTFVLQSGSTGSLSTVSDPNYSSPLVTGGSAGQITGAVQWSTGAPNPTLTGRYVMNTNTNVRFAGTGNYGYIGGGDLRNALSAINPINLNIPTGPTGPGGVANTQAYFVGYLSTGDGSGISGGTRLTFNGVDVGSTGGNGPASVINFANIQTGAYTFWSYEHSYISPVNTTADSAAVANSIADILHNTDASVSGLILNNLLLANKSGDGGVVGKNY